MDLLSTSSFGKLAAALNGATKAESQSIQHIPLGCGGADISEMASNGASRVRFHSGIWSDQDEQREESV
jgi:hypothetical protein